MDVLNKENHGTRNDIPHGLLSCCHWGIEMRMSSEIGDDPAWMFLFFQNAVGGRRCLVLRCDDHDV